MKPIILLTILLVGCGVNVDGRSRLDLRGGEPNFRLNSGMGVFLYGQKTYDYEKEFLDEAVDIFAQEFERRYLRSGNFRGAQVHFVPYDSWLHPQGDREIRVLGLAWYDLVTAVGAGETRLWHGAFIHELVHIADIVDNEGTDSAHKSWVGAVEDTIIRANKRIALNAR